MPANTYEHVISLKVSRKQKARLKEEAARHGMNVSEFHRQVLFDAIEISPSARLGMILQMAKDGLIKRLYGCYFCGVDITPDLLRQMEAEANKEAPKMVEDFIAAQRGAV
ncbi:MAG TPA: hypothetical protein VN517_09015 [Terriglobales bacterium]|nr:hypothetical protein [Terriglobales bacterium]